MANPPFNVDEIDADKVKNDPRLPFGLPGVNRKGKVSNGNYVWISYFYSYLNERGRAGFVMSSQASSAGRDEAAVRRKLVETGDVDIMIAIRSNFFYTRTVPCELWFLNRGKPEAHRDKVLMIDARNVYRKVTRKIYDFSPEQEQNSWPSSGSTGERPNATSTSWRTTVAECWQKERPASRFSDKNGGTVQPLTDFAASIERLRSAAEPFISTLPGDSPHAEALRELDAALLTFTGTRRHSGKRSPKSRRHGNTRQRATVS
jgi:type I restriction enzyme M protein